jgi:hypothetical protein
MKKIKLILIIAAVFGATQIFAQRQSNAEKALEQFGVQRSGTSSNEENPGDFPTRNRNTEPIGEGIAVLSLLGAAYAGLKARRNRKK